MPLFQINSGNRLELVKTKNFNFEKELQTLVEQNLETIFNFKFIATEFSTGLQHAGRIDSLALSEENNPVIIEYKKVESSELINQSLFYLHWINDPRGDFQVAVEKKLGKKQEIDWDNIRVLCIAPGYKKYDLHAVQVMGANIELWQYRLFGNGALFLEEVFRKSTGATDTLQGGVEKDPVMVAAGKKAALTRLTGTYSFEEHIAEVDAPVKEMVATLREFLMDLDDSVEEVPKKFYVAYKLTKNFCCLQTTRNKVLLYLKLDPRSTGKLEENMRDMTDIGHYGTGDLEVAIRGPKDLEMAKGYIRKAFENVGG